ncbi:MAG: hypothetical protein FWC27_00185, partial [Firmicutes bacterium]|nr:hypothetical protein [Bacillota bacterium]
MATPDSRSSRLVSGFKLAVIFVSIFIHLLEQHNRPEGVWQCKLFGNKKSYHFHMPFYPLCRTTLPAALRGISPKGAILTAAASKWTWHLTFGSRQDRPLG